MVCSIYGKARWPIIALFNAEVHPSSNKAETKYDAKDSNKDRRAMLLFMGLQTKVAGSVRAVNV